MRTWTTKSLIRTFATNTLPMKIPRDSDVVEYRDRRRKNTSLRKMRNNQETISKLGNTHFTSEVYKHDYLPFKSDAKNMAVKKGMILPKDIEDQIVLEKKPEGIDFYLKDDPGFLKATKEILQPVTQKMKDLNLARANEDTSSPEVFFESRSVNVENYNYYLACLHTQKKYDEIHKAFETMKVWGLRPNHISHTTVIQVSTPTVALAYMKKIMDSGISPQASIYHALVKSYVRHNMIDEAFEVIEVMKANGLKPQEAMHVSLLRGCIKSRDLTRAWNHYEQMVSLEGVMPNEVTYATMMHCAAAGLQTEKAISLLEEQELYNIFPQETAFVYLMMAYQARKDWRHRMPEVLEKMHLYGYTPEISHYNIMCQGYGKMGNVDKIKELVREMSAVGIEPTNVTFSWFFRGLATQNTNYPALVAQNIESADLLLAKMKTKGLEITTPVIDLYLKVFTYGFKIDRAQDIFDNKYKEYGLVPNIHAYTDMLSMYCRAGRPDTALQWLRKIESVGLKPQYIAYKNLIFSYIRLGRQPASHSLMTEMFEKYKYMFAPHDLVEYKRLTSVTKEKTAKYQSTLSMIPRLANEL